MVNIRSAVILCGGRGTRLGNLGKKTPKTLLKVQGKEILWYIINIVEKPIPVPNGKSLFFLEDIR